jgi:hypothetical protein
MPIIFFKHVQNWTFQFGPTLNGKSYDLHDRLCGLVVRVLGYRSGGPGSIPGTTRKKKVVGLERAPLSLKSTTAVHGNQKYQPTFLPPGRDSKMLMVHQCCITAPSPCWRSGTSVCYARHTVGTASQHPSHIYAVAPLLCLGFVDIEMSSQRSFMEFTQDVIHLAPG